MRLKGTTSTQIETLTGATMITMVTRPSVADVDALISTICGSISTNKTLMNGDPFSTLTHRAYRWYYQNQWTHIVDNGQWVAFKTPSDVNLLVQQLISNVEYREILLNVRKGAPGATEDECEASINHAARLLLMLKFGVVKFEPLPRRYLSWTERTLKDFVSGHFSRRCILSCDRVKLPKTFNT